MYDICVFAGRMRPPTSAHIANIKSALANAQYTFVIIGSVHEATNFKNPFTFEEVSQMVRASLTPAENDRVFIFGVEDRDNDLAWVRDVQRVTTEQAKRLSFVHEPKVALVGCAKDGSSYYLKLFRQWDSVAVEPISIMDGTLSATGIRTSIYETHDTRLLIEGLRDSGMIPHGTYLFLRQWVNSPHFEQMRGEFLFMRDYLKKFQRNPYTDDPQQFACADMFIFHAGAVLLVQRAEMPGKGLWASPGGHKRAYQTFRDAALDETEQETAMVDLNENITRDFLNLCIRGEKLLDNPWRSNREVTFSMAYGCLLPASIERPAVQGRDDARQARWWNTDEVTRAMLFEDHYNPFEFFMNSFRDLTI